MIRIISIKNSPRLQYTASVVFETILGIRYEILVAENKAEALRITADNHPFILYGYPSNSHFSIPAEALLFEDDIRKQAIEISHVGMPEIHFSEKNFEGYSFDFDLFSAVFYLVTQYENYLSKDVDEHGRYIENPEKLISDGFIKEPLVDIYAAVIRENLKKVYPSLQRIDPEFDYKITFDIDSPYLYKHKGPLLTFATLAKTILKLNINSFLEQIKVLSGSKDPYDVFDEIANMVPVHNLLFFFLLDRHSKYDTRYIYKNKAYRKLIKQISDAGIETGIHPSYTSYKNAEQIKSETKKLENIAGKAVTSSRMHFLKYSLPDTFNYLLQAGIMDDYTLCPIHYSGFKNHISRPFLWFDLSRNCETNLTIHPTMVMDRSLQKYMGLSPEAAFEEIKSLIDTTYRYHGVFTILFHNSSLSEIEEWKGWKTIFTKTIEYLAIKKTDFES